MNNDQPLKAPFPYPGGKSKVADMVWERFGDCDNYIEPFMGSLAVLLRRPADHFRDGYRVETCNDANHYLVNFWRAVQADPEGVARWADSPVNEADLHARHRWLVRGASADSFREWMRTDPGHYDAKFAGWWVWGQCCWIGGAWCNDTFVARNAMPQVDVAHGVHRGPRGLPAQIDDLSGGGVGLHTKMPELGQLGRGVAAAQREMPTQIPELGHPGGRGLIATAGNRPQLTDAYDIGRGVNAGGMVCDRKKMPHQANAGQGVYALPGGGTCESRREWLVAWMHRLADRLRLVRTCYGHWSRVCDSDSTLTRLGMSGVFLDPPYPTRRADTGEKSRDGSLYINDASQDLDGLRDEVLAWCRKWGPNKAVRVALCCYEGDGYESLEAEGWSVEAWEANGGYANQRRGGKGKAENAKRERIYFSPHCLKPGGTRSLFDLDGVE